MIWCARSILDHMITSRGQMSGEVSFFLEGVLFHLEHSKPCGIFVEAFLSHVGPTVTPLRRVGVALRLGEVPEMTDEPSGLIRTRELFMKPTPGFCLTVRICAFDGQCVTKPRRHTG